MSNYRFTAAFRNLHGNEIWNLLINNLRIGTQFQSVGNSPKTYEITNKSTDELFFEGGDRTGTGDIDQFFFADIIECLKQMKIFNTNSSRDHFRGKNLYKSRSPFFGLLLTMGVIEKI